MGIITENINKCKASLPEGVELCAVSKFHPAELIKEAYDAGQRIFGESRVQELIVKQPILPKDIEWHFIGHLQTNKIKYIVPFVSLIHSGDSAKVLKEINNCAKKCGRVVDVLLQLHVAQEETKSGFTPFELQEYMATWEWRTLENIQIRGVMGMATFTDEESVVRADFERLAACKAELAEYLGEEFDTLSMGMSDDYPLAIEYGSTEVRIGSTIFGVREY